MKIGITGTHGTGKTTLAMHMAAKCKINNPGQRVGIVSEVVRSCPFPVNHQATESTQAWIYHTQYAREIEAMGRNDIIICDRTVLDPLAYSQNRGFHDQVNLCMGQVLEWMKTYTQIHWLRPTTLPVDDGFRNPSLSFQIAIDHILAKWIKAYRISVIEYKNGVSIKNIAYGRCAVSG